MNLERKFNEVKLERSGIEKKCNMKHRREKLNIYNKESEWYLI